MRIDVTAAKINARAGGGGNTDHEIAGGCRDLEWNLHRLVHRDYFQSAGTNPEESGKSARAEHNAEAGGDVIDVVVADAIGIGKAAVHLKLGRQGIGRLVGFGSRARPA